MTLTVKMDRRIKSAFEERCRRDGQTKSEIIRRLIEGYIAETPRRSAAEVYDEVTGGRPPSSDHRPAGRDHSRIIKAKLRAKHGAR
ncbi:MAG: hypothetical protein A3I01_12595 [Betaproteobacteria bacterium RIFCSPLOWO2_02_FULL_65_24]|nr:MAG: hypothetical protein A3I01_12595 [Betaproteobacteria bacterium RIFCSPLOWO2_02_FULL_65_24]